MPIFSFHLGVVSRSGGGKKRSDGSTRKLKTPRSCQAAAAYKRAGKVKVAGQTWDYTRKKDVVHFGVYTPHGCPTITSEKLWLKSDMAEKRKDATTAREGHAALPRECTAQEQSQIMNDFAHWMVETYQVAFDASYHNENNNPHMDFQFTTRIYQQNGELGAKTRQFDELKTGRKIVEAMREQWAKICNKRLKKYELAIDHRSYQRQGLDTMPAIHLGQAAAELEAKGIVTERGDYNRSVKWLNFEQQKIQKALQSLRGEYENDTKTRSNFEQKARRRRHSAPQPSVARLGGQRDRHSIAQGRVQNQASSGKIRDKSRGQSTTNLLRASKPDCFAGKGQQGGVTSQSGASRGNSQIANARNHGGWHTGQNIINSLHHLEHEILKQVETKNIQISAGQFNFTCMAVVSSLRKLSTEILTATWNTTVRTYMEISHEKDKEPRRAGTSPPKQNHRP